MVDVQLIRKLLADLNLKDFEKIAAEIETFVK